MKALPGYDETERDKSKPAGFMTTKTAQLLIGVMLISFTTGCRSLNPAAKFIAQMDRAPIEKRPKDWEQTKRLMSRPVPVAGQPAPDFTLPMRDGAQSVTRSVHQAGRPLVLVFGSFT